MVARLHAEEGRDVTDTHCVCTNQSCGRVLPGQRLKCPMPLSLQGGGLFGECGLHEISKAPLIDFHASQVSQVSHASPSTLRDRIERFRSFSRDCKATLRKKQCKIMRRRVSQIRNRYEKRPGLSGQCRYKCAALGQSNASRFSLKTRGDIPPIMRDGVLIGMMRLERTGQGRTTTYPREV
jgi:hypothetical protein